MEGVQGCVYKKNHHSGGGRGGFFLAAAETAAGRTCPPDHTVKVDFDDKESSSSPVPIWHG